MERMLVVVFDNELKAYDGSRALSELDSQGSISIHNQAVIEKIADGKINVMQTKDDVPVRTVGGTAIGALIGLLGGPIGVGIGAITGSFAGAIADMNRAGVNADFLDSVSERLTPGKWAVVSDISEEWETPVDTQMAALGGTVFRTTRYNVENDQDEREVATLRADITELKAEEAQSRADQKAKIQTKIDTKKKKLNAKIEQAKQRAKQRREEAKAKMDALEKKAALEKGERKARMDARIAKLKAEDQKNEEAFDRWTKKNQEDVDNFMT